jgi:Trypsin-like peptidase domain
VRATVEALMGLVGSSRTRVVGVVLTLVAAIAVTGATQAAGVLRITVTLAEPGQPARPVPRHALLISDNPASTAPRRLVTAADGTVSVRLAPGNYTVESDQPVAFQGRLLQWLQTLDIAAGADTTLALTAENAEISTSSAGTGAAPRPPDAIDVLLQWQDSVVALWTPTRHASGVVIDPAGLVATSQQAVGTATTVQVQIGQTARVVGRVVESNRASDVAIVWLDGAPLAKTTSVKLPCGAGSLPPLTNGQEVVTLGQSRGRQVDNSSGPISRVNSRTMIAALDVEDDAIGGPVFALGGALVGVTSFIGEKEGDRRDDTRVVRADAVCDALSAARTKMAGATPPSGTPLPMEPATVLSESILQGQMKGRAGNLKPYAAASAGFDVGVLTPVIAYAGRESMDFANWSEYVAERPTVVFIRVTPRQAEKAWTFLARGLAMTQGIALPPIKSFKPGFARLQAFCGEREVVPIHPFLLERRVSETDAIHEGLYVFAPDAFPPECGAVRLSLYSEKDPAVAETVTLETKVLEQIWQDLAPYRKAK